MGSHKLIYLFVSVSRNPHISFVHSLSLYRCGICLFLEFIALPFLLIPCYLSSNFAYLQNLLFSPSLQILEKVKLAYDIPIVTDVHETIQVFYFVYFTDT